MEGRVDSNETQTFPKLPVVVTEMRQGVYRHLAESTVSLRRGPRASERQPNGSRTVHSWGRCLKRDFHFPVTVLLKPVWQPVTDARLQTPSAQPIQHCRREHRPDKEGGYGHALVCFKTVQV